MTLPIVMAMLGFALVTGQVHGGPGFVLAYFVAVSIQVRISFRSRSTVSPIVTADPTVT